MNNNSTQTEMRSKWVDAAKFMAIMGVMIDHTNTILYTNQLFAWFSYYSVSLFVVAMGITTMWSYRRNSAAIPEKVWKKCLGILRPYIVATVIYGVFLYKTFDFETLLHHIIRFDMSGPFYYVLLYLQLVLISPVLFRVFEKADEIKRGYIIETLGFLAVLGISNWTTKYSNILNVYGGGGKLLGGTYLILFYIGMWFGKNNKRINLAPAPAGVLALLLCGSTIAWGSFIAYDMLKIDSMLPFGRGFNPPSISFGVFALLIAATLFFAEMGLQPYPNGIPQKGMDAMAYFGRHTLYIFLYHRLFLDGIPHVFAAMGIAIENIWIKRVVFFCGMIFGSMLFEYILEKLHEQVRIAYRLK